MALCKLWPRRRPNWRKTYTWPWRLRTRSCPNIMLKSLQRPVYYSFQQISLILAGSRDHIRCGTRQWLFILRTRLLILPNTRRPVCRMRRMNTVPNIDECPSLNPKKFRQPFNSPLQSFGIWSIIFWSIWYVQRWWTILNSYKSGWKDTRIMRSNSMLADCRKAQFEFTTWITKELKAIESKS